MQNDLEATLGLWKKKQQTSISKKEFEKAQNGNDLIEGVMLKMELL